MSDPETLAFYAAQTAAYEKLAKGFDNANLTRLLQQLPKGAHVLDFGCGPGQDSKAMQAAGCVVTAMDASPEMVRQAARIPGIETRVAAFSELDDQGCYDAVWASFSLLHAPKADFPAHLRAIHRALKPQGCLGLSLKIGEGEARDHLGRFYAYYQEDELHDLLGDAGFEVTYSKTGRATGMAGTPEPFIFVIAHG